MQLVCLIVKLLKGLSVEHTHKEVQAVVVAVGNDAEDGLLTLSKFAEFQGITTGNVLDLRQGERGKADSGTY